MTLDSKHPLYAERLEDWLQMRHTYEGERRVKAEGFTYLPPTTGMIEDGLTGTVGLAGTVGGTIAVPMRGVNLTVGSKGWITYNAYRMRARFPDWVREAVGALVGVMHRKPAVIELPPQLEPLIERATARNDSLQMLLRRINEEQLILGRVGLLGDVADVGERKGQPYLSLYMGETIINWDEGSGDDTLDVQSLNLVVLDESENERSGFEWKYQRKFRVLTLGPVETNESDEAAGAVYRTGVFRDGTFNEASLTEPSVAGQTAGEIPFVFINSTDVVPEPTTPPLLGLANLALTFYRGQADYRQSLFMQGQDTLVVIGSTLKNDDEEVRVGAGARLDLAIGGDAKYIGVNSAGLSEQRAALENDAREAGQKSGQLLEAASRQRESGDALKVRISARTATLVQTAIAGAFGLQEVLRKMARWFGADPEAVKVIPNLDFADQELTGDELGKIMGAKTLGAPLSLETVHSLMATRGMTDKTFEEELAAIEEERDLELVPTTGSTNPDGPAADLEDDPEAEPETDPEDAPTDE